MKKIGTQVAKIQPCIIYNLQRNVMWHRAADKSCDFSIDLIIIVLSDSVSVWQPSIELIDDSGLKIVS